jgi:hypothetical protein
MLCTKRNGKVSGPEANQASRHFAATGAETMVAADAADLNASHRQILQEPRFMDFTIA